MTKKITFSFSFVFPSFVLAAFVVVVLGLDLAAALSAIVNFVNIL